MLQFISDPPIKFFFFNIIFSKEENVIFKTFYKKVYSLDISDNLARGGMNNEKNLYKDYNITFCDLRDANIKGFSYNTMDFRIKKTNKRELPNFIFCFFVLLWGFRCIINTFLWCLSESLRTKTYKNNFTE